MQLSTVYPEGPILRCSANLEWWSSLHCNVGTALQCSSGAPLHCKVQLSALKYTYVHCPVSILNMRCLENTALALESSLLHCNSQFCINFDFAHEKLWTHQDLHLCHFKYLLRITIGNASSPCSASC